MKSIDVIVGGILASAVWFGYLSRLNWVYHDSREKWKRRLREQHDEIVDLKARIRPFGYVLKSNGAEVYVERGRPDIRPSRISVTPQGEVVVIGNMDEAEDADEMLDILMDERDKHGV